jgi:hypothetical protein
MKRLFAALMVVVFVGLVPGPATAAAKTISVSVDPIAVATAGGASLTVRMTIACPAGYDVLEAFVYVVQGDTTSNFVPIPLVCRNQPQVYTLAVPAPDQRVWTAGTASLSGYILLGRRSETLSSSPSATLQVVVP